MSTALAFDTHAYVKKLRDAGVPEQQAEIQVEAIASLIEERMVTKQDQQLLETNLRRDMKELETNLRRDMKELETRLETRIKELETRLETRIKELETRLETRIKELEVELKHDIKDLETRLLIRLGGLLVIGIGAIATLIKLL